MTSDVVEVPKANPSTHRENKSVTVSKNLFPRGSRRYGPMRPTLTVSHGLVGILGRRVDDDIAVVLLAQVHRCQSRTYCLMCAAILGHQNLSEMALNVSPIPGCPAVGLSWYK